MLSLGLGTWLLWCCADLDPNPGRSNLESSWPILRTVNLILIPAVLSTLEFARIFKRTPVRSPSVAEKTLSSAYCLRYWKVFLKVVLEVHEHSNPDISTCDSPTNLLIVY